MEWKRDLERERELERGHDMKVRHWVLVLTLGGILMTGCMKPVDFPIFFDNLVFRIIGHTLFTNPDQLTMKEIHLDNGTLLGRQVVVEGAVLDMSEHHTYLVVSDETARLLVVLTDIEHFAARAEAGVPRVIRVYGTVESGKKGLPYLMARSVNVLRDPEKV